MAERAGDVGRRRRFGGIIGKLPHPLEHGAYLGQHAERLVGTLREIEAFMIAEQALGGRTEPTRGLSLPECLWDRSGRTLTLSPPAARSAAQARC
jgi:hypothetical protein